MACSSQPQEAVKATDELCLVVGTYTNGSCEGIYTFRFNQASGNYAPLDTTRMVNPSFLTASDDGKFVYAVSETSDSTASLHSFGLDALNGKLTPMNALPTVGAAPCDVATIGALALTANYGGGSMSVFKLHTDGSLQVLDTLFAGEASGPDTKRQASAHVHCTVFTPDSNYIVATDFSADRLLSFALPSKGGSPQPQAVIDKAPDTGPRHLTFAPNGQHAYLLSELSGAVTVFEYNQGLLKEIQTVAADTLGARGSADIHLSPDGKFLYASNRLKGDGLAVFAVNEADGTLTHVGYQPTGIHPRNFGITPNGKYLLVACRDSNCIEVYERNAATGLLVRTEHTIRLDKPVCICFVK